MTHLWGYLSVPIPISATSVLSFSPYPGSITVNGFAPALTTYLPSVTFAPFSGELAINGFAPVFSGFLANRTFSPITGAIIVDGNLPGASFASSSGAVDQWQGILPDPQTWFGLNYDPLTATEPADPACWPGSATVGYYYINADTGSDTGNPYGCSATPRATIPTTATMSAGGKMIIVGDVLTEYSGASIAITITGTTNTSNGYAYIGGRYTSAMPIISDRRFSVGGSYVIVDGIDHLADAQDARVKLSGPYACLRNYEVRGNASATAAPGSVISMDSNNIYYNGSIHDVGLWQTDSANDMHGMKIDHLSSVFVLNTTGYHLQGDTVQVGSAGAASPISHNIFLGSVNGYQNKENNIDTKDCTDVLIVGGYSWGMDNSYGDDPGEGITIHDGASWNWVINHEVYDCRMGIILKGSGGNNYAIGCIARDLTTNDGNGGYFDPGTGVSLQAGAGGVAFCTFYNVRRAIEFTAGSGSPLEVKGCAFAARAEIGDHCDIGVENSTDYANLDSDYNLFENFRGYNGTSPITSLASWNGDANSQSASANFVDAAADDYTPSAGSALIDNADPSQPTIMATFESRYGGQWTITWKDIYSNARPASYTDWDIGAVEKV